MIARKRMLGLVGKMVLYWGGDHRKSPRFGVLEPKRQ